MRIKNQLKIKKLVETLPQDGTNYYKKIKRLVEKRKLNVERAFYLIKDAI